MAIPIWGLPVMMVACRVINLTMPWPVTARLQSQSSLDWKLTSALTSIKQKMIPLSGMMRKGRKIAKFAVGTVDRIVHLMRVLAEGGGDMTIKAISESVSLPPSTVHRLLSLLLNQQIVERGDAARTYRVGPEFYRLGALVVSALSIRDIARPFLERVAQASGEVCLLMRYLSGKNSVMLEDSVDSPHPLRYALSLYEPLSVLWGATGRSVLAFLPDEEISTILKASDNSPATGQAPPSAETLKEELDAIRQQGYAMTFGQKIPGSVGFGVPVFDRTGRVFGSLCVTIPQLRFEPSQETAIAALLQSEASALSAALGYAPHNKAHAKRDFLHG